MTSRSQPIAPPESGDREALTTAAGDWWDARLLSRMLPEHALPDEPEALLWTQRQEQQP